MLTAAQSPPAAEAAVEPRTPRNTLRCRACHTPLVELVRHEQRVIIRFLVPVERDPELFETSVPCPACGKVRTVTHR